MHAAQQHVPIARLVVPLPPSSYLESNGVADGVIANGHTNGHTVKSIPAMTNGAAVHIEVV